MLIFLSLRKMVKNQQLKHSVRFTFLGDRLICAVPLVLERIYKSILDTMHRKGWAFEELFDYFMKYKMKWQDRGFDTPILNKTVFR
jgi:long-subunit acyl-CoA synthetase (AMP-forming)